VVRGGRFDADMAIKKVDTRNYEQTLVGSIDG
jgi:hypothetical protein